MVAADLIRIKPCNRTADHMFGPHGCFTWRTRLKNTATVSSGFRKVKPSRSRIRKVTVETFPNLSLLPKSCVAAWVKEAAGLSPYLRTAGKTQRLCSVCIEAWMHLFLCTLLCKEFNENTKQPKLTQLFSLSCAPQQGWKWFFCRLQLPEAWNTKLHKGDKISQMDK